MTKEQEDHIDTLKEQFCLLAEIKYSRGVEEHEGNLWELSPEDILEEAIGEAIDQVIYLLTLKQKLGEERALKNG